MSIEINIDRIDCPGCDSTLLPERLYDVPVLCANCHEVFYPSGRRTMQRTSRKAIASFMLGLVSLIGVFLTGIPAILLGISAFRDIQRSPRSLKGKPLAVAGVASGTVFGFMLGTCVCVIVYFIMFPPPNPIQQTDAPDDVARIAARIADFETPRGTDPLEAVEMDMAGMRTIVYGRDPRPDHPLFVVIQYPQGTLRQQVEMQIRDRLRSEDRQRGTSVTLETENLEWTINGQTVPVSKTVRSGPDRFREYIAEIPIEGRLTFVALITPDEAPSGTDSVALTEAEVRAFFESFR